MIFASFHRFISVSTRTATKTVLVRNISTISLSRKSFDELGRTFEVPSVLCAIPIRNNLIKRCVSQQSGGLKVAEQNTPASSIKRRPLRKKRLISEDLQSAQPGFWHVKALATAEDYNLETLMEGLLKQDLYIPRKINTSSKCLYSLELNEQGDAAMKMALSNPHRFVLKPQREGGGNNVYGQDIKVFLESMKNKRDRTAYILMERIQPPSQLNYIVRPGDEKDLQLAESTVELGIFGVVLGDAENIILNKQAGHMMRSKLASSNEGGLMVGSGACDSPYLID